MLMESLTASRSETAVGGGESWAETKTTTCRQKKDTVAHDKTNTSFFIFANERSINEQCLHTFLDGIEERAQTSILEQIEKRKQPMHCFSPRY